MIGHLTFSFANLRTNSVVITVSFVCYIIVVHFQSIVSGEESVKPEDAKVIQRSFQVTFPSRQILEGYEQFDKRHNVSVGATMFLSKHFADHILVYKNPSNSDRELVILAGINNTVNAPFKNVTTYLVLRKVKTDVYASHLVYIK